MSNMVRILIFLVALILALLLLAIPARAQSRPAGLFDHDDVRRGTAFGPTIRPSFQQKKAQHHIE